MLYFSHKKCYNSLNIMECCIMDFADKIKFVRSELELSQEELAHKIGVSFATINRWENEAYKPSRLAQKAFEDFCKDENIKFEE